MHEQKHTPATYPDGSPYYFHAATIGAISFDMRLCIACGRFYAEGQNNGVPIRHFCPNPPVSVVLRAENSQPEQTARQAKSAARIDAQDRSAGTEER